MTQLQSFAGASRGLRSDFEIDQLHARYEQGALTWADLPPAVLDEISFASFPLSVKSWQFALTHQDRASVATGIIPNASASASASADAGAVEGAQMQAPAVDARLAVYSQLVASVDPTPWVHSLRGPVSPFSHRIIRFSETLDAIAERYVLAREVFERARAAHDEFNAAVTRRAAGLASTDPDTRAAAA